MEFRTLTTVDEFRQVCALEQQVWSYPTAEELVPVIVLLVSSRIGGLVTGAFNPSPSRQAEGRPEPGRGAPSAEPPGRLVGFVYAMPGVRDGKPFQWSHMLGVEAGYRNTGLGRRLKLEQRRLVMASGLDLIAWTFDPLQAMNAHLNFAKLGTTAREYHQDAYPDSTSALHAGTPTDRLVAEWWLRSERVVRRLDASERGAGGGAGEAGEALRAARPINRVRDGRDWIEPAGHDLSCDDLHLSVTIPTDFTEMQQRDLRLAQTWRTVTREIFTALLSRGYAVDDFVLDRPTRRGTYLLTRT